MLKRASVLVMAILFAATLAGCKKDKGEAPKSDPAAKPADPAAKPADPAAKPADPSMTTDKPATDPVAAKPADPAADKPADKPAEPAAPAEIKWEKFTSKEGGFTVELPGKGDEKDVGNGMKMAGAEFGKTAADDRTSMCGVGYLKLPKDAKIDQKAFLEKANATHKASGEVIEDKEVKLGKHTGKHLVVKTDKHQKWMRTFLIDKTVYMLNCGGPFDRAKTDGPIATKVLESFALAK